MGMSTVAINRPVGIKGELTSTSDFSLSKFLGKIIPVTVVDYLGKPINWEKSDNGKIFANYGGMFCEFENIQAF